MPTTTFNDRFAAYFHTNFYLRKVMRSVRCILNLSFCMLAGLLQKLSADFTET